MNAKREINRNHYLYILLLTAIAAVIMIFAGFNMQTAKADQLYPSFSSTDGSTCTSLSDGDYFTTEYFDPGTEITLTSEEGIESLYIIWEYIPDPWTLKVGEKTYTYGKDGYLHEFIELPDEVRGAKSVTIVIGDVQETLADVYAFSSGTLPGFVQNWEAPYEEADILLISTHADDEALFFGGIIPTYVDRGDVRIQLAYFSDLFQTEPYRNHEILNGLWKMGVTHYPQLGEFYDYYSESYEEAVGQYDYESSMEYIVRTIRRFKPQVLIGQDINNGEYGHGGHIWCARIMADALEVTADANSYPESAAKYGTWDVPKTYFHLYPENTIELDARVPLSSFGGQTARDIAKQAYQEHQSQLWCWFQVSDGYDDNGEPEEEKYSSVRCTYFGLYRTLVGPDYSGNDILDNIVTYDEQIKQAELESKKAAEAEALALAESQSQEGETETQDQAAQSIVEENGVTTMPGGKHTTVLTILVIVAIILALVIIGIIVVTSRKNKVQSKKKRAEKNLRSYDERHAQSSAGTVRRSSSARSTASRNTASRSSASRSSAGRNVSGYSSGTRSRGLENRTVSDATARRGNTANRTSRSYNNDSVYGRSVVRRTSDSIYDDLDD